MSSQSPFAFKIYPWCKGEVEVMTSKPIISSNISDEHIQQYLPTSLQL